MTARDSNRPPRAARATATTKRGGAGLHQQSQGLRRGPVFSVRVTTAERDQLLRMQADEGGPRGLGPWMLWRALDGRPPARVLPARSGPGAVLPELDVKGRIILDLCGGSGSWSEPYRRAGYDVRVVTLPDQDVRTYVPPRGVHGILAAPPCTEFSVAKNGLPRDFVVGMETVNACMRIILQARRAVTPPGFAAAFFAANP